MKQEYMNRNGVTKDGYKFEVGMWITDTQGTYEIVEINYNRRECKVNEIWFLEGDDYKVNDTYWMTFYDMHDCYYE